MKRIFLLFALLILALSASCVPKPPPQQNIPTKVETDVSATEVVKIFLNAFKEQDFNAAYDQLYVLNTDREGYISGVERVYQETGIRLLGYTILATQLFKDNAIVIAELETERPIENGVEKRISRSQYDLVLIKDEWKITRDSCIENCN